jgi:hypothetical protein
VDGLPHLFAEKVRQSLRNKNDGLNINYLDLTYGQIIGTCINEGLTLCNDIKLKNQLKKQKLTEKHQLGEFCEQFAFNLEKPIADKHRKKEKISSKNSYKNNKNKSSHKRKHRKNLSKRENFLKRYSKKRKAKKMDITCQKCDKAGHYANQCWTKNLIILKMSFLELN